MLRFETTKSAQLTLLLGICCTALVAQERGSPRHMSSLPKVSFEVATIRPMDPKGGMVGFLAQPGGRVKIGSASVKMLIHYAFDVQEYQIDAPEWAGSVRYNIEALDFDPSRLPEGQPPLRSTPTAEERRMILSLLEERFALRFHHEMRERQVYFLERAKGQIHLEPANDTKRDPRAAFFTFPDGTADGRAMGFNVTTGFLSRELADTLYLGRPVIDRTGLTGSYDFHLEATDPGNHDVIGSILNSLGRLGLKVEAGRHPVDVIVVDSVSRPTEN